jgi:hypothetical protein
MKQFSSSEIILQLAYGELSPEAEAFVRRRVEEDAALANELEEVLHVQRVLDAHRLSPSATSIGIIMAHSAKTAKHMPQEH